MIPGSADRSNASDVVPTEMLWRWTEIRWGDLRWACARVVCKLTLQPSSSLQETDDWSFFFRPKNSQVWKGGCGVSYVFDPGMLDQNCALPDLLPIFAGFPFAKPSGESCWGEFAKESWLVPQYFWQQEDEQLEFCALRFLGDSTFDSLDREHETQAACRFIDKLKMSSLSSHTALPTLSRVAQRTDYPSWQTMIEHAQAEFARGSLQKVVLCRALELEFAAELEARALLTALFEEDEEAFLFAWKSPSGRCFIGRSPERLLAWNRQEFYLDSLAGTRSRKSSDVVDQELATAMLRSPKERAEHNFVGDAIVADLGEMQARFQVTEAAEVLKLKHVQHLRTSYSGVLPNGRQPIELLRRLHPTPAVGGLPKQLAVDFILAHEHEQRGWYCGGVGFMRGLMGDFAIAIRSALLVDKRLLVFAGAGIVDGSIPEMEWQETEYKMQNFLSLFSSQQSSEQPLIRSEEVRGVSP